MYSNSFNISTIFRQQVGLAVQETPVEFRQDSYTMTHLKNIVGILQQTPGFNPTRLISVVAKIITKPETQALGQKVAEGLAQKMAVRLIRSLLLEDVEPKIATNSRNQPSLPAA